MKKLILIISILGISAGTLYAQDDIPEGGPGAERIHAAKVAYITDRLKLTPTESEKFWPLYNQYEAEQRKIRQKYRPNRDLSIIPDNELDRFMTDQFEMEEQLLRLKRDYFGRMKNTLAIRKLAMLPRAEREFNMQLLRKMQEGQPPQKGPIRKN